MKYDIKKFDVEYKLPTISYDLSELKEQISTIKETYGTATFTSDEVDTAKSLRKQLNKLSKSLSRKRIDLTKEIKDPISKFENEVKLLETDVKQTSEHINKQIKKFKGKDEEEKKQEILEIDNYDPKYGWNDKWLNKSYKLTQIEKDIDALARVYSSHKAIILSLCSNELDTGKYYDLLDEGCDIEEITSIIDDDKEVKERYAQTPPETDEVKPQKVKSSSGIKYTKALKFTATKEELNALKDFLDTNNYEYEVLKLVKEEENE